MAVKIDRRAIAPVNGWVLVSEDGDARWYICCYEVFSRKKYALGFAAKNNWPQPYRAVRGVIGVHP